MIWALIILIAVLAAIPFVIEQRRKVIGLPDRTGVEGSFVPLSQGVTHYRWIGPARGPVVVAIHGLTTPSPVWQAIAAGLNAIGYRVLTYDLYGRGLSDAPQGAQDSAFFLRQLTDLLADQGLDEDLTLLGYSMGGSIATAFVATYPERMKRLILLAPAGIEADERRLDRIVRQVPLLGDWLFLGFGAVRMRAALKAMRDAPTEVPGIVDVQLAELDRQGFLPAVLSSGRHMLSEWQQDAHRAIGRADIPVVAIWGEADTVIPLRALGTLAQWNRAARQEVIAGAGHPLAHTHATQVTAVLRDVLREV